VLPLSDVIRDGAVQLGLTRQRGAVGVDSSTTRGVWAQRLPSGPGLRRSLSVGSIDSTEAEPPAAALPTYGDEKVANRDIRVWHGATENGP
jgi:hypothetical protein